MTMRVHLLWLLLPMLFAEVCQATEPLHNPAAISFADVKTYGFRVSFNKSVGGADGYVVLRKTGAASAAEPADGVIYQRGDFIGDAQVVYVGPDTSFYVYGATANDVNHFCVFAYNGTGSIIDYRQSSPCANFLVLPDVMVNDYYDNINPEDTAFVTQLRQRVRVPYTLVSYHLFDETMVEEFAARLAPGGKKTITCAYSGQNYDYTPPFTWTPSTPFSREHTWCVSWMPNPSTSSDQYADQHHLFPVNQNQANAVRSNHPLGLVTTVTNAYLDGKLGYNTAGQLVYEPRDAHKGDAARALLYMTLRYDGVNGMNWTFNWLNGTRLPSLGEAPQSVGLLLQWCQQDPPDAFERTRNDYVQSLQQNRNPFVDRPDYLQVIDFNTLAYQHYDGFEAQSPIPFNALVYPVPSSGEVRVVLSNVVEASVVLRWYNVHGVAVKEAVLEDPGGAFATEATDLPPGLYMLLVYTQAGTHLTRWIKTE